MKMSYERDLVMPKSYTQMRKGEMEFVEGGTEPLYVEERMLDKNYCNEIAAQYTGSTGLSQPRIAMEIYAHAVLTLAGCGATVIAAISDVPLAYITAQYLISRGGRIDLGGDAWYRVAAYAAIWCGVPSPGEMIL